ncbi:MAG: hypothetical protein FWE83_08135 [Oscillospiraceae bacterium]|nr:hypothetical protein [Oscillospiraceae bacterium]
MMTNENRMRALQLLGAIDEDMDALLAYTSNAFTPRQDTGSDELPPQWPEMWERVQNVCSTPPRLEIFTSVAGPIPIVYPADTTDFEGLLREIIFKGKDVPNLEKRGAQFVFGKAQRFIILTDKPYSGVPAKDMGLSENEWLEKSMIIRKNHECAHYYTKRFFGSSKNHLHDELIADFNGLYTAFGEYCAAWFIKFFEIRFDIYVKGMSVTAANVIRALATVAAKGVEKWTKTEGFAQLDEAGRIEYLAGKELLTYVGDGEVAT